MQLAPMRYTRIEGSAVEVSVKSATEAKAAVKELRQRKSELKFLRKDLVRRQRALRPKQGARRGRAKQASTLSKVVDGVGGMIGGLFDHATAPGGGRDGRALAEIEHEIRRIDEILHNIEGCILQLQGKLLTQR
jgi:hypothetical protein